MSSNPSASPASDPSNRIRPRRSPPPMTAAAYLEQMDPSIRASLTPPQLAEIGRLLDQAAPRPAPKIVDLRFSIDLLLARYFIVLLVGQDRRQHTRRYTVSPLTRLGNRVAAITLLISLNLMVSLTLLLGAYLAKSALNINLLPGHFWTNLHTK